MHRKFRKVRRRRRTRKAYPDSGSNPFEYDLPDDESPDWATTAPAPPSDGA